MTQTLRDGTLGLRGVFRDPAGPQHGEGCRTADGREGADRGRRHPKILTMMTAGARNENAPWGGWRRKEEESVSQRHYVPTKLG
jgi:hypothetical protein